MRSIDADKLEAKCKEIIAQEREYGTTTTSWANAYESFLDLLETTPTIDTQRWIPVSERLPEHGKRVLVCDVRENYVHAWEYCGKNKWLHDNCFWNTQDITHWMPLPEAPKEDE